MKLTIDVGTEQRTLVAGISEAYEPEQLVGRTIVMVFNLKPAKLMGIESNGMVLAASPDGGKPMLVGFDQDDPAGTRVARRSYGGGRPSQFMIDSTATWPGEEFAGRSRCRRRRGRATPGSRARCDPRRRG